MCSTFRNRNSSICLFFFVAILLSSCYAKDIPQFDDAPPCRFASLFSDDDLLNNPGTQDQFLKMVMYYEGFFHYPGVGYNGNTGFTFGEKKKKKEN